MDAALLLAALATRAGDRVDLLAFDRRPRATVAAVADGALPRLVDAMARSSPRSWRPTSPGMVAEVLRRGRDDRRWSCCWPPPPTHVLVAAVADPRVAQMAAGRGDSEAVYGAAAAERDQAGRFRVSRLLERHGAHVVDAPPDELAPAVADAYLSLKAAGKL